jgi:hypothetical protein
MKNRTVCPHDWPPLPPVRQRRSLAIPAAAGAGVIFAFWVIGERAKNVPVATAKPQVKVVTHTIVRTVASHPLLSGTQVVWITLILAVAVVGGLSVAARLRR